MRRTQKGFTLIELMIVVAIVGILASVAVPAYSDYTVRAKVSEAVAAVAPVKASVADYYYGTGELPATAEEAGLDTGGDPAGSNYSTAVIDTIVMDTNSGPGSIKVTLNEDLSENISGGDSIIFTPTEKTAGQLEWNCTNSTLPDRFAPASCRG